MALRNIVTVGDSVLSKPCRPVTKFDKRLHTLLDDMADTLDEAQGPVWPLLRWACCAGWCWWTWAMRTAIWS